MRVGRRVAAFAALFTVASLIPVSSAHGQIIATSGQILQIAPPPSAVGGLSTTNMSAWNELQGVTVASGALKVDITSPGVYTSASQLMTTCVPAGTVVDSHYISSVGPLRAAADHHARTLTRSRPTSSASS